MFHWVRKITGRIFWASKKGHEDAYEIFQHWVCHFLHYFLNSDLTAHNPLCFPSSSLIFLCIFSFFFFLIWYSLWENSRCQRGWSFVWTLRDMKFLSLLALLLVLIKLFNFIIDLSKSHLINYLILLIF